MVSSTRGTELSAGPRRVGMAVVGLGGAVATTAVAGLELLRIGASDTSGLPLAGVEVDGVPVAEANGMADYAHLGVGGWGLAGSDPPKAPDPHRGLDHPTLGQGGAAPSSVR